MPRIRRGRGSRQTGTSAPTPRAALSKRGSSSGRRLARASSRSAAAASDEPPPRPAATGRRLSSVKRPSLRSGICAASARAALSTRLSSSAPACLGGGAAHVERQRAARAQASAGRRRRRTPPGFRARDSRRRAGRARASVRLTLAGADSTRAAMRSVYPSWRRCRHTLPKRQCPARAGHARTSLSKPQPPPSGFFGAVRRGRRGVVGRPARQLLLDLDEVVGLGLEVAGVRPLELAPRACGRSCQ